MFRKYFSFNFGHITVEELFKAIFIIGLIPIIFIELMHSSNAGLVSSRDILGILIYGFIILFFILITIVVWKIICELLFLIFKSLEVFIRKNQ